MGQAAPNDPPDQLVGWAERGSTSLRRNRLGAGGEGRSTPWLS